MVQDVNIANFHKSKTFKRLLLPQKNIFLKKCIHLNILLPSNDKKSFDFDLLLIQQKRKLSKQLKDIEEEIFDNKYIFDNLNYHQRKSVTKAITKQKYRYKRKISWLLNKQKDRRNFNLNTKKFYPKPKTIKNKKDRTRYLLRKKHFFNQTKNENFNDIVLNKSKLVLNNSDKELLSYGPQFIPTPKWDNRVIQKEKENLLKHIRTIEWKDVFMNKDDSDNLYQNCYKLSNKLSVPNFSRPEETEISKNTKSYIQVINNKFRNLKPEVIRLHKLKNNLNKNLQDSLKKLRYKTQNKEIVIGNSDKDGKIIIMNYEDYINIIEQSLINNYEELTYNEKDIKVQIKKIKEKMVETIIKMWEKSIIDDNLLFKTTGLKKTKPGSLRKISGIKAKYFANDSCGYIYPLWKTHKLTPETLKKCNINDIPTRIVQAAGNTYLSRFTALLNHLLEPISIRYCKFKINDYCKDSKSYLEDLKIWKNSFTSKDCTLSTVDIVSLYPSLSVSLVTKALVEALNSCSEYDENTVNNIVGLCKLALSNNFIVFQEKFYKQKRGIITGDNNSVTIANISLHYIMIRATKLSSTFLVRRYIDDIIFISKNKSVSDEVIADLIYTFDKFNLKLTYTNMSTEDNNLTLPFLDVEHVLTKENNKSFFYTRNFIKPTAINSTFLNGKSFHPLNIFKGIISGEEKRMKRLNERNEDYQESLKKLKNKCIKSNFNLKVIETQFQKIQI